MRASVVIGSNYGDEGKGLMTDFLAVKHGADLVIRFNGGAQAGHTVVTPDGDRHVFSHFGSGTLAGVPTLLSKYFIINPILFVKEYPEIAKFKPKVFADPRCMVSTPWDMIYNQFLEEYRSEGRHGSCGVGIGTTTDRYEYGNVDSLNWGQMISMFNSSAKYPELIENLYNVYNYYYILFRSFMKTKNEANAGVFDKYQSIFDRFDQILEQYLKDFKATKNMIETTRNVDAEYAVFEGAQGLALDQCMGVFPNVTRSNTGLRNIIDYCREFLVSLDEIIYVTRTYNTRHGAGDMKNEFDKLPEGIKDDTNVPNSWQGSIRFGKLDMTKTISRIILDTMTNGISRYNWNLAITHADQYTDDLDGVDFYSRMRYISYGPTRQHVCNHSF